MVKQENRIKIVVITHGRLGKALIETAELIMGRQTDYYTFGLFPEDSVEDLKEKVNELLCIDDFAQNVLCFVDMVGGSPFHVVLQLMANKKITCITGVNLPMILTAFIQRDRMDLSSLKNECISAGIKSNCQVEDFFERSLAYKKTENDF